MVSHSGQSLDQSGHSRQRPQIGAISLRPRPLAQSPVHHFQLLAVQLWLAASTAGSSQRSHAAPPPLSVPAAYALAAHSEGPGHRRQNLTGAEQLGGLLASIFEGLEISSRRHASLHASIMHQNILVCNCIMRDSIGLSLEWENFV